MPELPGRLTPWNFGSLKGINIEFNEAGFELYGLEGDESDLFPIKLDLPQLDELIKNAN